MLTSPEIQKFPSIVCDGKKLLSNINCICAVMHQTSRTMCAVIKGFCADDGVMKVLEQSNCDWFGDSRIEDLAKLKTKKKRFLIRLSQMSEISDVIKYSDVSFESEIKTIKALQIEAKKQNKIHEIILAIDMGDLREGIFFDNRKEIDKLVNAVLSATNLKLIGIGTNLGCFGGVKTDSNNMRLLLDVAKYINIKFSIHLDYISGMSTAALGMLFENKMPIEINHGRFGEGWLLGYDSVNNCKIDGMYEDVFQFKAQIIEIKSKPSKPIGIIGGNAFGEHNEWIDKGNMIRGILAFGSQDVDHQFIFPYDNEIDILGQSSDHTIIDITHTSKQYQVGDVVDFGVRYHGLLNLFTSKYVKKYIV